MRTRWLLCVELFCSFKDIAMHMRTRWLLCVELFCSFKYIAMHRDLFYQVAAEHRAIRI